MGEMQGLVEEDKKEEMKVLVRILSFELLVRKREKGR